MIRSVLAMIKRVGILCSSPATNSLRGARLWAENRSLDGQTSGDDVHMGDANGLVTPATELSAVSDEEDTKSEVGPATYINVAMKFLSGFFENSSSCSAFVERGGAESVLDLATADTLKWNFNSQAAGHEISRVIHMLAEQKPHLVLPH